jgi:plastocyanin
VTLTPGTQQTVTVTFPNSGSTEFFCRFHESMGMTGELQVA